MMSCFFARSQFWKRIFFILPEMNIVKGSKVVEEKNADKWKKNAYIIICVSSNDKLCSNNCLLLLHIFNIIAYHHCKCLSYVWIRREEWEGARLYDEKLVFDSEIENNFVMDVLGNVDWAVIDWYFLLNICVKCWRLA